MVNIGAINHHVSVVIVSMLALLSPLFYNSRFYRVNNTPKQKL